VSDVLDVPICSLTGFNSLGGKLGCVLGGLLGGVLGRKGCDVDLHGKDSVIRGRLPRIEEKHFNFLKKYFSF
jgi:hypothetical protein